MATKGQELSSRQRRRIRADVARRLVESDIKDMQECCSLATADSIANPAELEDSPSDAVPIADTRCDSFTGGEETRAS